MKVGIHFAVGRVPLPLGEGGAMGAAKAATNKTAG
jgi:hypothetical protein